MHVLDGEMAGNWLSTMFGDSTLMELIHCMMRLILREGSDAHGLYSTEYTMPLWDVVHLFVSIIKYMDGGYILLFVLSLVSVNLFTETQATEKTKVFRYLNRR